MRRASFHGALALTFALCLTGGVSAQRVEHSIDVPRTMESVSTPAIVFATSPAVLVRLDGDANLRDVAGTPLKRVVNTKALILKDESNSYYLKILDGWMEAYTLGDWWDVCDAPPEGADVALRQAVMDKNVDLLAAGTVQSLGDRRELDKGQSPAVYVSTVPTVLVVTDGALRFATIPGTSLEYVENTTAHLFRERPTTSSTCLPVDAGSGPGAPAVRGSPSPATSCQLISLASRRVGSHQREAANEDRLLRHRFESAGPPWRC